MICIVDEDEDVIIVNVTVNNSAALPPVKAEVDCFHCAAPSFNELKVVKKEETPAPKHDLIPGDLTEDEAIAWCDTKTVEPYDEVQPLAGGSSDDIPAEHRTCSVSPDIHHLLGGLFLRSRSNRNIQLCGMV